MRRSWLLAPVVVVLVGGLSLAAVAAAGGETLSERQWRKKTNVICERGEKLTRELQQDIFGELKRDAQPSLEQMTAYVDGVEPILDNVADGIAALREPKALEKKVKRFVRAMRRDIDRVVGDPSLGLEGNPFSDTTLAAEALRLKSCS